VHQALAEIGRVRKTIFVLRFLDDATYRHRIGRELNKGERSHALSRFLFFGKEGAVRGRSFNRDSRADGRVRSSGCRRSFLSARLPSNLPCGSSTLTPLQTHTKIAKTYSERNCFLRGYSSKETQVVRKQRM
jgi:hypothetical protein